MNFLRPILVPRLCYPGSVSHKQRHCCAPFRNGLSSDGWRLTMFLLLLLLMLRLMVRPRPLLDVHQGNSRWTVASFIPIPFYEKTRQFSCLWHLAGVSSFSKQYVRWVYHCTDSVPLSTLPIHGAFLTEFSQRRPTIKTRNSSTVKITAVKLFFPKL